VPGRRAWTVWPWPSSSAVAWLVTAAGLVGGCEPDDPNDDGAPACIDFDVEQCTPQYAPEFERIFTETLVPSCGVAGSACHGASDAAGAARDLHITELDATYAMLRGEGGVEFVTPGDPSCSLLMVRMNTDDPARLMPPGAQPLREGVRCSIARWIAEGAQR
jgi:hypothetical protein